jgi:hypothetical protein
MADEALASVTTAGRPANEIRRMFTVLCAPARDAPEVVMRINVPTRRARQEGVPVLFIQHEDPDDPEMKNFGQIPAPLIDAATAAVTKTDLFTDWAISHGERVMGAATPADMFQAWREYHTRDASPLVTQDVLLMAGTKDWGIPLPMLGEQLLTLTAARSVTARVFTEAEQAQKHCQIGNTGLALRVILNWIDAFGGRAAEPAGQ